MDLLAQHSNVGVRWAQTGCELREPQTTSTKFCWLPQKAKNHLSLSSPSILDKAFKEAWVLFHGVTCTNIDLHNFSFL